MAVFTEKELKPVNLKQVPRHVAFIMDGNRRWAKRNLFSIPAGHSQGVETLNNMVRACKEVGVQVMTCYAFSTENWNRPKWEVNALIEIFHKFLREKKQEMIDEGVQLHTIGDISAFPDSLINLIHEVKEATKEGTSIDLILALNYGARDEIRRATLKALDLIESGALKREEFTEDVITELLDTSKWPDPDVLIRTSGEKRLSNFLLWQLSYSEVYITDTLWPEFGPQDLIKAILDFQKRKRRWGT
ncbi:MAG: polyprenyl diphosphate synthase [Simkaniaceae bacterium]|nr:polyprenyl diphosphate synthase [Simkaniaceae bacterium]